MIISLDKYKATGGGTKVEGDIAISENGIYDVTTYATANVYVQPSDNYSYFDGVVDIEGLRAIGWDDESIGMFRDNNPHYSWQNSVYIVSEENKALYGVIDSATKIYNYRTDPNFVFCPVFQIGKSTSLSFKGCTNLCGIPKIDTNSSTYGLSAIDFGNCIKLSTIPLLDTSMITAFREMFNGCSALTGIPHLDTSNVTDMYSMFCDCKSLTSIPQFDTSKVTHMGSMFKGCSVLTSIPQLDTSKVTKMSWMFDGCSTLTSIPQLDTSNVTDMSNMFQNCKSLKTIPHLDTSKVTNMENMFRDCKSLTSIPQFDTSKVTNINSWLNNCTSLYTLPSLNFSNATSINLAFANTKIEEVGNLNLSKLTYVGASSYTSPFYYVTTLKTVGEIKCDSLTDINYFLYSTNNDLTNFGGVKNLGMQPALSGANSNYFMTKMPNLTYESVLNVLNGLYDRASAGYSSMTLKLHANHLALLSEEDISIATAKGWTLTV